MQKMVIRYTTIDGNGNLRSNIAGPMAESATDAAQERLMAKGNLYCIDAIEPEAQYRARLGR